MLKFYVQIFSVKNSVGFKIQNQMEQIHLHNSTLQYKE